MTDPRLADDESPSWVVASAAPASSGAGGTDAGAAGPVPVRLRLALVVTCVLAAAEAAHVVGRDELVPGFRGFLVLVIALQVPFAVFATRRSAGAVLALLVYQGTTVLAALIGGFGDLRLALGAGALVDIVLVAGALHTFPTPTLPPLVPPTHPPLVPPTHPPPEPPEHP